jgi:hypothetical protein
MAKGEAVTGRQAAVQFSWPVDEDGAPMALVTMQLSELIGLPNYSNVTVGPGSVTKFVKDTKDGVAEGLRSCAIQVETILAEERQPVLDMVGGGESAS